MSTANRHLRLGIVYRGSIIHEELIDRRIDISIGRRAGSTIHVAPKSHPDFPEFIDFLVIENNQYHLVVPADPNAKISLRGAANPGEPKSIKGRRAIPVESVSAGSMVAGEVTVMFQFVRGDTIPMITRERTVLRLGLVYDDRLIDDRIYPDEKEVSVGIHRINTIVLPDEDYQGPSLTFLNHKDGSISMRAPDGMKIRLAVDGAPMEIKELEAKGKARKEGTDMVCHLGLGTRGRATMGQHTLLFQVVKQSVTIPAMPSRTLSEKVVAGVLAEPAWWISFGVSFLLILGVIFQAHYFEKTTGAFLKARSEEQVARGSFEQILEMKEEIKVEEPKIEEVKKVETAIVPKEVEKKAEKKPEKVEKKEDKAEAKAEKPQSVGERIDPTEKTARATKAIEEKTVAGAFKGLGASSKFYQEAGEGEASDVVAKNFGGAGDGEGGDKGPGSGGVKLAAGAKAGGTVEKVVKGKPVGFEKNADATKAKGPDRVEAAVVIKMSGDTTGSGESKADVAKVVSRKNSAVQKCYEQALRDNPDVGGKVKVTFTVGTEGTVTDVSVSGATGGFADCIKAKFESIRGLPVLASPQTFGQSYVFSKGN